ncbi:FAD-dependent monooxygenase [Kribbella sp. NPDC051952]|uniref:FAD-dependent monooxygenase n=1 Tax=Kribbella sp. NPDC051952 TaxID=3154851 RepID=UPI003422C6B2
MVDVLVVGAGPTGLILALQLKQWGMSVRIVERSLGPQEGSRGFGIKPRTLEIFDALGIADQFLAAAGTAQRTKVHLGGALLADFTLAADAPTAARPYPNYVSMPQWKTEEILRTSLSRAGVEVEFGTAVAGFVDEGSSVLATFEDGTQERASYLVGCDGGRSTVRKALGVEFEGSTTEDARALLADVDVTGLPDHAVHLWMGDQQMLALRPYREGEPWQAVASIGPGQEPSLELLQRIVAERSGVESLRVSNPRWMSVWRYSLRIASRYRVGRVFLAGDAAHVHSPFGAFGLNTGVQDAFNLGWKLALVRRGADETLLDTYEAERLPVGQAILAESDRRFSAATAPPRLLRPILPHLVKPFLVRLNKRGRTDHPRYPASPLTLPARRRLRWGRALAPGDTAPDGVGRTPGGRSVRLFDLFRGPHFTVLAFGRELPAVDGVELRPREQVGGPVRGFVIGRDVIDVDGTIRRSYPRCAFAVIRPDGYVAALIDDAAEASAYLERWAGYCPDDGGTRGVSTVGEVAAG